MTMNINSRLSLPEISGIWNSYVQDSLAICLFDYFLSNVKDKDIRSLLEHAQNLSKQHINRLKDFLNQEGISIPQGFTKEDVYSDVPSLFNDEFYLFHLNSAVNYGMTNYSIVLNNISRPDVREYFSKCMVEAVELYNKDVNLLLSKGIFIEAPMVEVTKKVTFIKKDGLLGGLFGEPRALLAREVAVIYANIVYNIVNRGLFSGFAQVANSKQVSKHLLQCRDISSKHIEILSSILSKENIPIPSTPNSFITDSTTAPFSDRLMMFHSLSMEQLILSNIGIGLVNSLRRDLQLNYTRLAAEISKCSSEGLDIYIDNGWMEQPPQVINSENILKC